MSSRLGFRSSLLSALLLAAGLMLGAFVPRTEAQVSATGGTQRDYVYKGEIRRALVFTTAGSNTLSVSSGGAANVLVVAGGGGGGAQVGGGGGAGGFVESNNFTLATGDYWVQVGGGGAGATVNGVRGNTGTNSFLTNGTSYVTAYGGGGGGYYGGTGNSGGSGGGGGNAAGGSASPAGQGNNGGNGGSFSGGGGGGAGSVGSNSISGDVGGAGGIGKQSALGGPTNGSMSWYAGGGGGCSNGKRDANKAPILAGAGGRGGGGNGRGDLENPPQDGTANTGGGGGGRRDTGSAGKGGSGIVIVDWITATGAPDIENRPVSGVTASSATFNGFLASTGSSQTAVYVLWGTNNGSLTGSSWANTNAVPGTWTNASSPSITISSLSQGYVYYYTFAASNALTNATAIDPVSFWYSNGVVKA
ncbi:MAG: glycine-rich domain-containing protein, partial [bacterium]